MRLVVFDCDGTLVDSQAVIVACAQSAFAANGLPPPAPEAIRRIVGLSLGPAMGVLLGRDDPEMALRIAAAYKASFVARRRDGSVHEPLFPGAIEVLDVLEGQGRLLGVATGKALPGLLAVLRAHGLEERFVTLQTADRHPSKPHPSMLEAAMRETGAGPNETAIVGDTTFDIEMGLAAGCRAIGVAWGNHPADELRAAGADTVIERFEQLTDCLA